MKTFLKVLASIGITLLFFVAGVAVTMFIVFPVAGAIISLSGNVHYVSIIASMFLVSIVILCIIYLLTHNLLKKLVKKSLWVYIIQSGSLFTLFFLVDAISTSDEINIIIGAGVTACIIGGTLLSAIIRTIKQRRTKNE
ncbi:MAG: hypothetical protein IKK42_04020 [Oscillospiraceae bacterium]|nr:hypothetical protein [Oscillospiraceae bacterium]